MDLVDACIHGNVDEVKKLLLKGVNPSAYGNLAIRWAASNYHIKVVEILLQDGRADPTIDNNQILTNTATYGDVKMLKLLLQDGRADPTVGNNYAIKHASFMGYTEIVSLLLQDGRVDPTDNNEWAIRYAKTPEIKDMLIAYKYRVGGKEYQKLKKEINI
jgi:ankyrin repeat protein